MDIVYLSPMNPFFIISIILFTIVIFGLPTWNIARLAGKKHWLFLLIPPIFFLGAFWLANIFESQGNIFWYQILRSVSFYVLIVGMMLFGISILASLFSIAFSLKKKTTLVLILVLTFSYAAYARINGERIVTKQVNLETRNITRDYQFVHISDLHSGSTDVRHAQRVVERIKKINPEFVVITGDFIDEFYVGPADIAPFNALDMPIYLVTGNHEYYLPEGSVQRVIEGSVIQLIDSMKIQYDELDIIGVDELQTVDATLELVGGVDENRYTILLDHQPLEDEALVASENGISLMLSGHTHKGQIWPMGLLLSLRYRYIGGLYEIGKMFLYVNAGTGTLGPKMRLGTANEVTHITLSPSEEL